TVCVIAIDHEVPAQVCLGPPSHSTETPNRVVGFCVHAKARGRAGSRVGSGGQGVV
ncbi:unnamed protein product, partial [Lampetra planeri]